MNAANKYRLQRELQVEPDVRHSSHHRWHHCLESLRKCIPFVKGCRRGSKGSTISQDGGQLSKNVLFVCPCPYL